MSEQQADETTETPDSDESSTSSGSSENTDSSEASSSEDSSSSELEESGPGDIGDDKLPEDLQPKKDNPLARHPGQTGDDDDKIGADTEGSDAENPTSNMAYGSEGSNAPSDHPDSADDSDEDSDDHSDSDEG